MFEKDKIFEMNTQCEVLDTIKSQFDGNYIQKFTNTEGKIFLLDTHGKVFYWDPISDSKAVQIQDLLIERETTPGSRRR